MSRVTAKEEIHQYFIEITVDALSLRTYIKLMISARTTRVANERVIMEGNAGTEVLGADRRSGRGTPLPPRRPTACQHEAAEAKTDGYRTGRRAVRRAARGIRSRKVRRMVLNLLEEAAPRAFFTNETGLARETVRQVRIARRYLGMWYCKEMIERSDLIIASVILKDLFKQGYTGGAEHKHHALLAADTVAKMGGSADERCRWVVAVAVANKEGCEGGHTGEYQIRTAEERAVAYATAAVELIAKDKKEYGEALSTVVGQQERIRRLVGCRT